MNINFGIIESAEGKIKGGRAAKKEYIASRGVKYLKNKLSEEKI